MAASRPRVPIAVRRSDPVQRVAEPGCMLFRRSARFSCMICHFDGFALAGDAWDTDDRSLDLTRYVCLP